MLLRILVYGTPAVEPTKYRRCIKYVSTRLNIFANYKNEVNTTHLPEKYNTLKQKRHGDLFSNNSLTTKLERNALVRRIYSENP